MPGNSSKLSRFWQEFRKRKVPRVMTIYAGTAFIILEASDITPEGISKTKSIEESETGDGSLPEGKKNRWISNVIIAILILIIGYLVYPKIFKNSDSPLAGTRRSIIAVLPLKIIGDDSEINYLASGLVESLTYMLTKAGHSGQSYSVIPSSEIIESITAEEARKRFGATLVITGSIQMDHSSSRLILNLIDTKRQNLIKSEKLDYDRNEELIIQDAIISDLIAMLGLKMEAGTKDQLLRGGAQNRTANEYYLVGRGILREGVESVSDIDDAIDQFQKAILKDSLFAMAYAGIAQSFTIKYHFTMDPKWNDESLKFSRIAISLNDQDSYALISLASSLLETGEYDKAEEYLKKAVHLDPSSHLTHYYLGAFFHAQNRYKEAIVEFNKALDNSPGHLTILHALGASLFATDQVDDAKAIFEEIIAADSTHGWALMDLGTCYLYMGDFNSSIDYYHQAIRHIPLNEDLYVLLGKACYWSGNIRQSNEAFRNAISIARNGYVGAALSIATYYAWMGMEDSARYYLEIFNPPAIPEELDPNSAFRLGEFYLILGNQQLAYPYLEWALKRGIGSMEISHSPLYKSLSQDRDFNEMIERSKSAKSHSK